MTCSTAMPGPPASGAALARPWRALLVALALGCALLAWPRPARAQADVEVSAALSAGVVEEGEVFTVELTALTTDQAPFSNPALRVPHGLTASGPSVGTKMMMQFGTGGSSVRRGLTATWRLSGSRPGSYSIPPPTIEVGGTVVSAASTLRVKVVPLGQRPPGRAGRIDPFGLPDPLGLPFDPFGRSSSNSPLDLLDQMRQRLHQRRAPDLILDEPVTPDMLGPEGLRLSLAQGDDEYLFLRLVPDKPRVVVGEQVTLRYYAYNRVRNEMVDRREPSLGGFQRVDLDLAPGQNDEIVTGVAGRMWKVRELDSVALFPLRPGQLPTGRLEGKFRVAYLRNQVVPRTSNEAVIEVAEPPRADRPVGYRLGDVGRYALEAEVAPRETVAGEAVAVKVTVKGRGALPTSLRVPERSGVEWLTPETREELDVVQGKVGGWRSFGYAVRIVETGTADLGVVELPYWDPDRRRYQVARVGLGDVTVKARTDGGVPVPALAPSSGAAADPFASLARHRPSARPFEPAAREPLRSVTLWSLVVVPSALVLLLGGLKRGWAVLGRRRAERRTDPATRARRALRELGGCKDLGLLAAAVERAVHLGLEAATGLKSRGVLLDSLVGELGERGLDEALATEARTLLDACAVVRFDPAPDLEQAPPLAARGRRLVKRLLGARGTAAR